MTQFELNQIIGSVSMQKQAAPSNPFSRGFNNMGGNQLMQAGKDIGSGLREGFGHIGSGLRKGYDQASYAMREALDSDERYRNSNAPIYGPYEPNDATTRWSAIKPHLMDGLRTAKNTVTQGFKDSVYPIRNGFYEAAPNLIRGGNAFLNKMMPGWNMLGWRPWDPFNAVNGNHTNYRPNPFK